MTNSITPCLWFDGNAEEAVEFYSSVFPGVTVHSTNRMPDGKVLIIEFEVVGQRVQALNGGPQFPFTEAISLVVNCTGQAEVDRLWNALTADGGEESQCGWLRDKFGLSWQIVPSEFGEMMGSASTEQAERTIAAMLKMRKLDIAVLRAAYDG